MEDKKLHRVQIASVDLPLYSAEEEDYVKDLAHQLDTRIRAISKGGRGCSLFEAAILCALDLLDEKVRGVSLLKTQQSQILSQLEEISLLKGEDANADLAELADWEEAQVKETPSPFKQDKESDQVSLFAKE